MTEPLVSVIIPFYNHRDYIAQAVERLHTQTYAHWEALLVDNNSTDGARDIALELQRQHPGRVRYVHQPRQGIPFARNKGLAGARGKYVSFLDVDDEFIPSKLSDQVAILEQFPEAAMVYGLTRRVYRNTGRTIIQGTGIARDGINRPPALAMDWMTIFYHLPQTGATLVRTEVARDIGGFAENLLLGNDDVAYHLKIALNYPVYFLREEAVIYNRHSNSEGARLNREQSVSARYFDARRTWIMPYVAEYERRTGDHRARYFAERSLFSSLIRLAHERTENEGRTAQRRLLDELFASAQHEGYLNNMFFRAMAHVHAWLPRKTAGRAMNLALKTLAFVRPERFPLTPTLPTES